MVKSLFCPYRAKTILMFLLILQSLLGYSQKSFRLYEGKAPGSENWDYKEIEYVSTYHSKKVVRNVVDPTIELFSPDKTKALSTAVIVCPGGGNYYLEYVKEGTLVAEWLAKKGITAFVLKYRLNKTPEDPSEFKEYEENWNSRLRSGSGASNNRPKSSLSSESKYLGGEDGIRAIEFIRNHAAEFNIDPNKVGIMGFSAGGAVTMYSVLNSAKGKQPNFAAPIYGGNLNGKEVPADAPPIFIAGAADDAIAAGSSDLYKAWRNAGKSAELHIYSKGGHGFGLIPRNMPVDSWIERFYDWLKISGF